MSGILFAVIVTSAMPLSARATSVLLSPVSSVNSLNARFAVDVLLDPEGKSINALGTSVSFPETLSYDGSSDAGSVISAWVESPHLSSDGHSIVFSGIIPGGFSGLIDPFTPTVRKPGLIARLYFKGSLEGTFPLSVGTVESYLNDGKGTQQASVSVPVSVTLSKDAQQVQGVTDTVGPLPFIPRLVHDPLLYGGKYAVVFSTTDASSGIDHYEVREGKSGQWEKAASPYVLKDQTPASDLQIRAVDSAGNVTTVEVRIPVPEGASEELYRHAVWHGIVLSLLIVSIVAFVLAALMYLRGILAQ